MASSSSCSTPPRVADAPPVLPQVPQKEKAGARKRKTDAHPPDPSRQKLDKDAEVAALLAQIEVLKHQSNEKDARIAAIARDLEASRAAVAAKNDETARLQNALAVESATCAKLNETIRQNGAASATQHARLMHQERIVERLRLAIEMISDISKSSLAAFKDALVQYSYAAQCSHHYRRMCAELLVCLYDAKDACCCLCYEPDDVNALLRANGITLYRLECGSPASSPHIVCAKCYEKLEIINPMTSAKRKCPMCRGTVSSIKEVELDAPHPRHVLTPPIDEWTAHEDQRCVQDLCNAIPEDSTLMQIIANLCIPMVRAHQIVRGAGQVPQLPANLNRLVPLIMQIMHAADLGTGHPQVADADCEFLELYKEFVEFEDDDDDLDSDSDSSPAKADPRASIPRSDPHTDAILGPLSNVVSTLAFLPALPAPDPEHAPTPRTPDHAADDWDNHSPTSP